MGRGRRETLKRKICQGKLLFSEVEGDLEGRVIFREMEKAGGGLKQGWGEQERG